MHGDWAHLISNSAPMAVLGMMLFYFYWKIAWVSYILIYTLCGLAVWLFARGSAVHIGASGVIYGLVAFIFWNGIFRRDLKSIILLLIVTILYSGMMFGILPNQPGISWESHLLGALAGIALAWYYKNDIEEDEVPEPPMEEEEKEYFLRRDAFEVTMAERERDREG